MKFAHACAARTFCTQENLDSSTSFFLDLLSNSGSQKETSIEKRLPDEGSVIVLSARITKESEINHLLKTILSKLTFEEKKEISTHAQSYVDDALDFFLRIEKKRWVENKEVHLTLSGDCYHLTFALAAYPRKKEAAIALVKEAFSGTKVER